MAKNENQAAPGQELGRKLSVASFGWKKPAIQKTCLADENADVFLIRVIGVASSLRPYKDKESGETRYGAGGQFEATGSDGSVLNGTVLYLPRYVQDGIEAALAMEDTLGVRIAYDVYAKYDEASATSYTFIVRDLLNEGSASVDSVREAIGIFVLPAGAKAAPAITDQSKS
jgi:hypothetical protein